MAVFTYTVQADDTTIELLLREVWQAGKKTVHFMRMAKSVTDAQGNPVDWRSPLPKGTVLHFGVVEAQSTYFPNEGGNIKICYEDDHLLVAWKPAGVATHPSSPNDSKTFMNDVMAYIQQQGGVYAEHVHRLDKGTEGVLLIAKHPIAKTMLDRMLEENKIQRVYRAEVDGNVRRPRGTINRPIGKDRHHPARRRVSPTGQAAVTHFKVIERKPDTTIVEATLATGRTHQIRVHFTHLGHPVVGDTIYGGSKTEDGRFHLTAQSLTFVHPFTNQALTIH